MKSIEHCVRDIRSWMLNDNLKLNDSKTEFLNYLLFCLNSWMHFLWIEGVQIQSKSLFFRWAFLIRAFYCNSNFSVSYNDVFVVTFPSYSLLFIALFDCNILTLKLWCAIENVMEFAHLDSSSLSLSLSLLLSLSSLKTPQYYHCHGVALLIRYSRSKCCLAHVWMLSTKGGAILRDTIASCHLGIE